jgi:hypothetical protein
VSQKDAQTKGEEPRRNKTFREWQGVYTKAARVAIPEDHFFDLVNLMPIGAANLHSIPDVAATGINYGADTIYWAQYVNIGNTNYLLAFSTTGKIFAYNIDAGTSATIKTGMSGSGTRVAQFKNVVALFIDSTGFYSWDGTTFSANLGGIAGSPSNGTDIAIYQGRVWVVQGRTIAFSGADDGSGTPWTTLWTVANGAGFVQLTDNTVKGPITRLWPQNGYLYVYAGVGISIISDVFVPTGANPPTPVFNLLNISSIIGTDQPASIFAFGRSTVFATRYGVYQLYGVAEQRISEAIDGTWQYLDTSLAVSGGSVIVNNILCAGVLFKQFANPEGIEARTTVGMYFDKKWWFANYGALTFVASAVKNNTPVMFGFIGNVLYQLFGAITNGAITASPATKARSALWSMEDVLARKNVIRAGLQTSTTVFTGTTALFVDTSQGSTQVSGGFTVTGITWINNSGAQIQFVNNVNQPLNFFSGTVTIFSGDAPGSFDNFAGLTYTTTGAVYELNAFFMDYKLGARWG